MSVQHVLIRARPHRPQGLCAANLFFRELGTRRGDDSVKTKLECLKRRILTPAGGSNADNEMPFMRSVHTVSAYLITTTPFSSLLHLVIRCEHAPLSI